MPETLILEHGLEFAGTALGALAEQHGVRLDFIQPGQPVQNAFFIESFNSKFRDECLNEHGVLTLEEPRIVIEAWQRKYNEERTHSTSRDVTLMGSVQNHQDRPQAAREPTSSALVYQTEEVKRDKQT